MNGLVTPDIFIEIFAARCTFRIVSPLLYQNAHCANQDSREGEEIILNSLNGALENSFEKFQNSGIGHRETL